MESKQKTNGENATQSWFLEKIKRINYSLARLIMRKRERTEIPKLRNERRDITTDLTEIQTFLREEYK